MIRSLFIGFLILSALTTNGADAQIVVSTNITAVALRDIFGAASACAEKAAVSSGEYCRISGSDSSKTSKSNLLSINSNNDNEVFIVTAPSDGDFSLMSCLDILEIISFRTDKGMYCCMSGLSPPA